MGDRAKSQSSGSLKQKEVTLLGWTDSILIGHCVGTQTNVQHSEDPGIQVPVFHQNGAILNNNLDFFLLCGVERATPSTVFLNVIKEGV